MDKEYIERGALYRFLSEQKDKETGAYSKGRNAGLDVARSALHNREITPAADVAPVVHGRWRYNNIINFWQCSSCGVNAPIHENLMQLKTKYCPSCGAKMDGVMICG